MAANELEIKITTNTREAEQGLSRLQATVQQFGGGVKAASINVSQLKTALDATGSKFKPTTDQINKANFALTNTSRVLQDLPFGLIGIANNIEPLIGSFQSLTRESGGIRGAFKAIGSQLLGGGGLILGIGVVTSAMSILGQVFRGSSKDVEQASEAAKEYQQTLSSVSSSISKDAARAGSLVNGLIGGDLSLGQRKKALEELKGINAAYFGQLKEENGVIVGLQNAYLGYLSSLREIAKQKAIESQLSKLFDRRLQIELKLDPRFNTATNPEIQAQIGRFQKQLQDLGGAVDLTKVSQSEIFTNKKLQQRVDLQSKINELQNSYLTLTDKATTDELKRIDDQIRGLQSIQDIRLTIGQSTFNETKEVKAQAEAYKNLEESLINLKSLPNREQPVISLDPKQSLGFIEQIDRALKDSAKRAQEAYVNSFKNIADSLTNTLAPAFQNLFSDLASGSENAFRTFGNAIKKIIIQLIAAAATAAILSAIIGAATGGKNFGAGATNFAGGFKGLFSQLSGFKFANGTNNFMGGLALVGENGPEYVNLPRGASVTPNYAMGGNGSITINGVLRGENIYLSNQNAGIRRARLV